MISAPTAKALISYLSSLDALSALYDENFVLQWTNGNDFFEGLDVLPFQKDDITKETHYRIPYGDEYALLTITPILKSKRVVTAYTATLRGTHQTYKMMSCTSLSDYATAFLEDCSKKTDILVAGSKELSNVAAKGKEVDILIDQNRILSAMNVDMKMLSASVFAVPENITVNCNISFLLSVICDDVSFCLRDTKRKLNMEIETKNCYTKISHKLLEVAMAEILEYHLLTSPLKSNISITTDCNEEKHFIVSVKSKTRSEEIPPEEKLKSGALRALAGKIIMSDLQGEFYSSSDGKSTTTQFSLPVFMKNRGSMLTSKNSLYLDPDYKPMRPMLKQVVESEIEVLEVLKMEASKRKKLDSYS